VSTKIDLTNVKDKIIKLCYNELTNKEKEMRINDENLLREMRKNTEKNKRVNIYNVKYRKHNNEEVELLFNQGYDASTDVYNPFFVRVYNEKGSYVMGGTNSTIEGAYNRLITQLILYKEKAETERNEAYVKLSKILAIIAPNIDEDEIDDRY
jgi:hypothetical protein